MPIKEAAESDCIYQTDTGLPDGGGNGGQEEMTARCRLSWSIFQYQFACLSDK